MSPSVENIVLFNKFSPYRLPGLAAAFDASDLSGITADASNRVSQWNDKSGLARHLIQGTGANQPLLLPWNGANYAYLPGVTSNNLSTPDAAAINTFGTGTLDLQAQIRLASWTPAARQEVIVKWDGGASKKGYMLSVNVAGTLVFFCSSNGTTETGDVTSSVATGFAANTTNWIRVRYVFSTGKADFYTSSDGVTWNALGTQQTSSAGTTPFVSNTPLYIGNREGTVMTGNVYAARIYNGDSQAGGTLVAQMNAAQAPHNATSWVSSTGETWTVNQSGSIPAQIVGRSSVLFDGAAYFMATSAFALNQPVTYYFVGKQITWTNQDVFLTGGANKVILYQSTASPTINMFSGSSLAGETNLALGAIGIKTAMFNGASSALRTNLLAGITGDVGASNGTLFTMGSDSINPNYSNIQVQKAFVFSAAHDTATQNKVIRWLAQQETIVV